MPRKSSKTGADISLDIVKHVAKLSRLDVTEKEAKKYRKDLNNIISAFRELENVKPDTAPTFHPVGVRDILRQDREEPCMPREKALANTRHREGGFFTGPRAV